MGKGGAPTTTQTVQNQNVAYTPTGLGGFQDIYNRASQVASQPYQPYGGQLVQGLNPTQTGAISNITGIANNPLSASQIQQYENPYQQDVVNATMGNINETNRQQMAQTTGQLTQAAGGIGASRIALGQGELARQQALASNQTLAGLNQQNYSQALGTAQQQQGFGLGAAQAQLGAGGLQQQTGQAGLTAAYQQYLQQLAFPYQQAQFMAGIGLPALGAMGGQQYQTGTANQTVTPPGLSWAQGIAGAGALGYGLFGGSGQSNQTNPTAVAQNTGGGESPPAARGGRIYPHFADGGDVGGDDSKTITLGPDEFSRQEDEALAPVLGKSGYIPDASAPKADEKMPTPMAPMPSPSQGGTAAASGSGGVDWGSIAKLAGTAAMFLMKEGGRVHRYDDGGTVPQQGMGSPGMNAYPSPAMLGSPIARGALPQSPQMNSPNVFYGKPLPNMLPASPVGGSGAQASQNMYEMARQALQQQQLGQAMSSFRNHATSQPDVSVSEHDYARGGYADGGDTDGGIYGSGSIFGPSHNPVYKFFHPETPTPDQNAIGDNERLDALGPSIPSQQPVMPFDWRFPDDMPPAQTPNANDQVNRRFPTDLPPAVSRDDGLGETTKWPSALWSNSPTSGQGDQAPTDISSGSPYPKTRGGVFDPATASSRDIMNLDNYKNQVAQRPTVRGLMNNPDFWMRTGLGILAANPTHGPMSAIASGTLGTVGEYDKWSKEDLSSKQKAQELAGKLMEHAQKYTKLTAHEKAQLEIEHEKLQQGHYQAVNYTDSQGRLNVGRFNTKTGQIVDSEGSLVSPSRLYGRSSQIRSDEINPQQMSIIIDRYRKNHPSSVGLEDDKVRDLALQEINASRAPTQPQHPNPDAVRPNGVPIDAGFSPSKNHWFSRDGHEWDENGQRVK